ncbi:hypothetical protein E4T48_00091 [Aureobasidium sp. EXF-10727]|nr:hypothetical protein E4T48_00091 [Aureobasidium sp. EXF-10727]
MSAAANDKDSNTETAPSSGVAQQNALATSDSTQPSSLNPPSAHAPATTTPSIDASIDNNTIHSAIKPFPAATENILGRLPSTNLSTVYGSQEWEAARNAVLKNMTTSTSLDAENPTNTGYRVKEEDMDTSINATTPVVRGGRGRNRGGRPRGSRGRGRGRGALAGTVMSPISAAAETPPSTGRGRGRGRGGRPRGRGGRGGRKPLAEGIKIHEVSSDSDDDLLDDAENTPLATTSRSGRAITKPTTFVPVIPSPTSGTKRKRNWGRRNPELAVCKQCLRPHSPATNMIVFCDGCNTPYHRYCHYPPISQEVVDVPDMEWFCSDCTVRPPPDIDVDSFVSGGELMDHQKRDVLMLLPTNALVDLLLRAEQAHPELALFPPGAFHTPLPMTLSDLLDPPKPQAESLPPNPPEPRSDESEHAYYPLPVRPDDDVDEGYNELENPTANYPKPGQGLAALLAPEENDLSWLVDDNEEVYSHFVPSRRNGSMDDTTMAGADEVVG